MDKDIVLSEKSPSPQISHYMMALEQHTQNQETGEVKNRLVVARSGGRGRGRAGGGVSL